jgi:DNA-directed RNA polymerase subunit RPC12/RpoP
MNRYKCPKCGGNQYSASPDRKDEPCIYCGYKGVELMNDTQKLTKEEISDEQDKD